MSLAVAANLYSAVIIAALITSLSLNVSSQENVKDKELKIETTSSESLEPKPPQKSTNNLKHHSGDWSYSANTGNHPLGWLFEGVPGMNQDIHILMGKGKGKDKDKDKVNHTPEILCPDTNELCDSACRDFGKSGGIYAFKQYDSNRDGRFSCNCFCSPPPKSRAHHGSIFPCTEDRACDSLCRNNEASWRYVLGGRCVRNKCQCNCAIEDPYDPSKPFYEPDRIGWDSTPPFPPFKVDLDR